MTHHLISLIVVFECLTLYAVNNWPSFPCYEQKLIKKNKQCLQMQDWEYVPAKMGSATIPPVNGIHTIMEYVAKIAQCMYKVLRAKI